MASPASVLLGPGAGGMASPASAHCAARCRPSLDAGEASFSVATVPLAEGAPPESAGYKLTRKGKTGKPHLAHQAVSQHPHEPGGRLNRRDRNRTGKGPEDPRDGAHVVSCVPAERRDYAEDGAGVPAPSRPKSYPEGVDVTSEHAAPEGLDVITENAVTAGSNVPAGMIVLVGLDMPVEIDMQDGLDVLTINCKARPLS